jgi:ubiquinone/menaquinone biosynthesis C-methylase UbiE
MELDAVQRAAQAQFARQSERYGRTHILADVSDVKAALERITLPSRADVLDVATGGGHTGVYLAGLGHTVVLADLAAPMLERARELAAERAVTVTVRQHAAEELPYENAAFDLVTCRIAAHHFTSPAKFIAETARVLKPGGHLLLIDGSVPDDEPVAEEWLHRVEIARDPSHHRLLSPRAWSDLCRTNQLRVEFAELRPMKQPDLEWYFETANTSPENRATVHALIANAPEGARTLFHLGEEEGKKIVWWWPRLTLIATKDVSHSPHPSHSSQVAG